MTDLLRGDIVLASPPSLYFALKSVLDDPNKSIKDAAFVIEKDATLCLKLLKIVNSAFFGFTSQIASIDKAINLVGTKELQNLVLSTIIIEKFSDLPGQHFSMHDYWAKNLRCALLTRELDILMGKKFADASFVCGLIHNIGQLLFYRRIPVLAREVDLLLQSKAQIDGMDQILIEQRVIGFDHFEAGAELCRLWKLPEIFVETIRLHAYPDYAGVYAEIAAVVRLSNYFSYLENPYDAMISNGLPLDVNQISTVLDKTNDEFETIFKLFYPG